MAIIHEGGGSSESFGKMASKLGNLQQLLVMAGLLILLCWPCSARRLGEYGGDSHLSAQVKIASGASSSSSTLEGNGRWLYSKLPRGVPIPPSGPSRPHPPPPPLPPTTV